MQLKNFQHHVVDKLVISARGLFRRSASSVCVLKAPTGSGKTIMMMPQNNARRLVDEETYDKVRQMRLNFFIAHCY